MCHYWLSFMRTLTTKTKCSYVTINSLGTYYKQSTKLSTGEFICLFYKNLLTKKPHVGH